MPTNKARAAQLTILKRLVWIYDRTELYKFDYYFFSAQGISDTEGEENVNARMTISQGGLLLQNCCGAK